MKLVEGVQRRIEGEQA